MVHVVWICPGCGISTIILVTHISDVYVCQREGCGRGGMSLQFVHLYTDEEREEMIRMIATENKLRRDYAENQRKSQISAARQLRREQWIVTYCSIM